MTDQGSGGEPKIRGAALLGFFKYILSEPKGEELFEKVISALPPETQNVCRRKVIAIAEYPYSVFTDFIRAADRVMGKGDLEVCKKLGRYAASRDIQFLTSTRGSQPKLRPQDLVSSTNILWKSYHLNSGDMETVDHSPDHTVVRIYRFPQMDPAHCRLMEGYLSQSLTETGAAWIEDVHEVKCCSRGDAYHEFVGRWKT